MNFQCHGLGDGLAKAPTDWSIIQRDDGTAMWVFKDKPLYTFLQDRKIGDVTRDNKDGFHLAM